MLRVEVHQPDPLEPFDLLELAEQLHEPRLAVEIHSIVGRILGDDDELLDAVGGELVGLADHLFHRLRCMLAAHLRDRAERAGAVAALGDLEISHVPGRDAHPAAILERHRRRRAEDAPLVPQAADEALGRLGDIVAREDADHRIEPGKLVEELFFLPLGEAASDDHAASSPRLLQVEHLADDPIRLLPGGIDEGAGVDDDQIGAVGPGDELPAILPQQSEHPLAVNEVLRAPQADHREGAAAIGIRGLEWEQLRRPAAGGADGRGGWIDDWQRAHVRPSPR